MSVPAFTDEDIQGNKAKAHALVDDVWFVNMPTVIATLEFICSMQKQIDLLEDGLVQGHDERRNA